MSKNLLKTGSAKVGWLSVIIAIACCGSLFAESEYLSSTARIRDTKGAAAFVISSATGGISGATLDNVSIAPEPLMTN